MSVLAGRRIFRSIAFSGEPALSATLDWLHSTEGTAQSNAFVLGMFVELYFDEHLEIRKTPLESPFEMVFDLQEDARFQPAIRKGESLIGSRKDVLLVVPSLEPADVDVSINLEQPLEGDTKELTSIVCEGKELLCDVKAGSESSLTSLFSSPTSTIQELLQLVSKRFTIPSRQLRTSLEPDTIVFWSELTGLCQLRTDLGGVCDEITIAFGKE
jgi:hypothetical protein